MRGYYEGEYDWLDDTPDELAIAEAEFIANQQDEWENERRTVMCDACDTAAYGTMGDLEKYYGWTFTKGAEWCPAHKV